MQFELDEMDKKITDYVGTDDDVALGKVCSNCGHELHKNKICNAFTKVKGSWESCDCKESTVEFNINVMVKDNDKAGSETIKPEQQSIKSFIPLSELSKK